MAKLLNIKTNLSEHLSPQYGYDRRGAGPRKTNASGQPYEVQKIPKRSFDNSDYDKSTGPEVSEDFLLRGGSLTLERTAKDVSRLTKMFFDLKSPNGFLFTAKQEILSLSGVNVLAVSNSENNPKNRRLLNNGLYSPTSTLAQVAVNAVGGHLLKQGADPSASTGPEGGIFGGVLNDLFNLDIQDPLRNPTYYSTVAYNERKGSNDTTSRLVGFTKFNVNTNNSENELYNYSGGPGSVLGVGRTSIKMLNDQRTGLNNPVLNTSGFFNTGKTPDTNFGFDYSVFKGGTTNPNFETFRGGTYFGNIKDPLNTKSVSGRYSAQSFSPITNLLGTGIFKTTNDNINGAEISKVGQSVYQPGGFAANIGGVTGLGSSLSYNQLMTSKPEAQAGNQDNDYLKTEILQDFREDTSAKSVKSPDYTVPTNRYEQRVKLGDAGAKNQTTSYVTGNNEALDKINALQIYKSEYVDTSKDINDLCKFRIGVIDNDNPLLKTYIHFRAFLDSMDDSYTAQWDSQKFAGRAENLYNYQGFDRKFNLSWTVAAQSKQELIPMYQKLNYLASVYAPDYSSDGYMRGNLITLTVGGYLYEQVGIMTGINYTVPMESPWEIAINDTNAGSDKSVKELPFMIKVSGFSFIPIHNFVPSIQKNEFGSTNKKGPGVEGDLATFGPERYIALSNGLNRRGDNNYDRVEPTTQLQPEGVTPTISNQELLAGLSSDPFIPSPLNPNI